MTKLTRTSGLTALLALGLATPAFAQTAILEYLFNDTGTTSASTGSNATAVAFRDSTNTAADLHGVAGSGVSGLAGDIAFNNSASNSMGNDIGVTATGGSGLIGDVDSGSAGTDWLTSFTVQGWFKADSIIGGAARILDKTTGATTSFMVRGSLTDGRLALTVDNQTVDSATGYTAVNEWVFFAVTYNGGLTTNNVSFYAGSTTGSVAQVGTAITLNAGPLANNTLSMVLGNSTGNPNPVNNRPFDGLLDNIRLYGSAADASGVLSLAQLESIRLADTAIPEPSSVAALFGAVSLAAVTLRRRRTR